MNERHRATAVVHDRLSRETDPQRRRQLELVIEHIDAERARDVDRVMATLVDDPHYHNFSHAMQPIEPFEMRGTEQIRASYQSKADAGICSDFAVNRVTVDSETIVTEGSVRVPLPGALVRSAGHDVADPDAQYLFETPICVIWTFTPEGGLIGEDVYLASDGFKGIGSRPLAPGTPWPPD